MKICALSDLHGVLPKIERCEIVFICGDIVPLDVQTSKIESTVWLDKTFTAWINSLPCKKVIMIAGNHDFIFEQAKFTGYVLERLTNGKLVYLDGSTYLYESLKGNTFNIYGSPYCHKFGRWAFMETEEWLQGYYDSIPLDVDIMLTHDTPAIGDLDLLPVSQWNSAPTHAGGESLAEAIKKVNPKYVFCGHLHTCKDKYSRVNNTDIYNVSILDNSYKNVYKPTYITINEE